MRIILTGGGTGGHVVPQIAIIEELGDKHDLLYIGSRTGIEKKLISDIKVPYKGIFTGKLRRYFSLQNILDFFKVPIGVVQAFFIIKKFNPDIVFSKGGFVAFPVVYAASILKKKIIIHESDLIPGLANKMMAKYADKILITFKETREYFKSDHKLSKKVVVTGNPIRKSILKGSSEKGLKFTDFTKEKPVLLVMGGSQGAAKINDLVFDNLDKLLEITQIVHLCGKGKIKKIEKKGYKQYEYLDKNLKNVYKITDLVVSRAGANSINEFLHLNLPSILIPLSLKASRGDQIKNAIAFEKGNGSITLLEEDASNDRFFELIKGLITNPDKLKKMSENLKKMLPEDPTTKIVNIILNYQKND